MRHDYSLAIYFIAFNSEKDLPVLPGYRHV